MKFSVKREEPLFFDTAVMKKHETVCVGGRDVVYSLIEIYCGGTVSYAISAGDSESVEVRILQGKENASRIYSLAVAEGVAPCTLNDVIDDILCATIY